MSKELEKILERLEQILPPPPPPTDWQASIALRWRKGTGHKSGGQGWLQINDTYCRMLGYMREELLEKKWTDLTHPDDLEAEAHRISAERARARGGRY